MRAICDETPVAGLILAAPDWIWPGSGSEPSDPAFAASYRGFLARLLQRFPASIWFALVTHSRAAPAMRCWLDAHADLNRIRVIDVEDSLRFSVWVSDIFVFCEENGRMVVYAPCQFPRAEDARLAERIARALGLPCLRSELFFQGGNLLVTRAGVLIGADDVSALAETRPGMPRADIARLYAKTLGQGTTVLELGATDRIYGERGRAHGSRAGWTSRIYPGTPQNGSQPIFHIDLCVTLLGGRRVAVGDPVLAGELCQATRADPGVAEGLNAFAATLARAGFDVVRVPLAFLQAEDPVNHSLASFPALSQNVIADFGTRRVFVPSAADLAPFEGLASLDAVHLALWEENGFSPVLLDDLKPVFHRLGGPRCLVKTVPESV